MKRLYCTAIAVAAGMLTTSFVPHALAQCETDKVTPGDIQASDRFGWSVAINGADVVVGADQGDVDMDTQNTGVVYVYMRNGLELVEMQKLNASDAGVNPDRFGFSVAIDGDFLVVGAANGDALFSAAFASGAAYVFRRNGSEWIEEAKISASDPANLDQFGASVAIAGDIIVVGAPNNDVSTSGANQTDLGAAYVFTRFDNTFPCNGDAACNLVGLSTCSNNVCQGVTWAEKQRLLPSDGAPDDLFGGTVAISGDRILIGSKGDDDACPQTPTCNSGSAYVFRDDGTEWVFDAKLTSSDNAEGDGFGTAVSIDGDVAVITALNHDDGALDAGSAYVFRRNGTDWIEEAELLAGDPVMSDRFGRSVSISQDLILVGTRDTDDTGSRSGSAYLFRFNGAGWDRVDKLTANDAATNDRYGQSVALDGDHAVIGAYRQDDGGLDAGAAYLLLVGLSQDCDLNNNPDACDILDSCVSPACMDVDGDGVPDGCQCSASDTTCADDRPCATANCNVASGLCEIATDGVTCLIAGACFDQATVNPNNECQLCDPTVDAFGWSAGNEGVECAQDDLFCNGVEVCTAGVCQSPGSPCAGGLPCNEAQDQCACSDDIECNDGLACTMDTCDQNQCVNELAANFCVIEGACVTGVNQANECEVCDPSSDENDWSARTDGTACTDDGNECTDDECVSGTCAHPAVADDTNCTDDGNVCTSDACVGGECMHPNVADDTPCDDGEFCNGIDTCQTGQCVHAGDPCESPLVCDEDDDECDCAVGAEGDAACDDGLFCTGVETCEGGACETTGFPCSGATPNCSEANGDCRECLTVADCSDDGNECTDTVCDAGGTCTHPPLNAGTACGDGSDDACTNPDTCDGSGACQSNHEDAGTVCDATAGTPCDGQDTCNGSGTCLLNVKADDTPCPDGEFCNGDEICQGGVCQAGINQCTNTGLACDEANDECDCADNAACDDDLFCTGVETCVSGACQTTGPPCSGATPNCSEANDDCRECLTAADCDDGLFCTGAETCNASGDCVDGNSPCTGSEICDDVNDLCGSCLTAADCDDGSFCNGAETCTAGVCESPGSPCSGSTSFCDETGNVCVACLGDGDCNDGAFCTGTETCSSGQCSSAGDPCGAGLQCDETDNRCNECEVGADCDDGDACTVDTCPGGTCLHTEQPGCRDVDGDGVENQDDLCPNSNTGVDVDADGCACDQLDDDDDEVDNCRDDCADTPEDEAANLLGCSCSQLDDDEDGVVNCDDQCAGTSTADAADDDGCSAAQRDEDQDGVPDVNDECEETPAGQDVNRIGCSTSQIDSDGDGVADATDLCAGTLPTDEVDEAGCPVVIDPAGDSDNDNGTDPDPGQTVPGDDPSNVEPMCGVGTGCTPGSPTLGLILLGLLGLRFSGPRRLRRPRA